MWHPFTVALLALAVLFSGCITTTGHTPEDAPAAWTDTDAPVWIVRTTGCGFCGGYGPWATATALYADGHVVRYSYTPNGSAREHNDPLYDPPYRATDPSGHVRTPAHSVDQDAIVPVARLLAADRLWQAHDRPIHVETVHLGVLSARDMDRIRGHLDAALREVEDPGPPRFDCEDCSATHLQVTAPERWHVALHDAGSDRHGNVEPGDPWARIDGQMQTLGAWVEA